MSSHLCLRSRLGSGSDSIPDRFYRAKLARSNGSSPYRSRPLQLSSPNRQLERHGDGLGLDSRITRWLNPGADTMAAPTYGGFERDGHTLEARFIN